MRYRNLTISRFTCVVGEGYKEGHIITIQYQEEKEEEAYRSLHQLYDKLDIKQAYTDTQCTVLVQRPES